MSRVGKKIIDIPVGVQVDVSGDSVIAKGPQGSLALSLPSGVSVLLQASSLTVVSSGDDRKHKAIHGLYRSLLNNIVVGVHVGFEKRLELSGVGYQCVVKGKRLELSVGFSKPVIFDIPDGVTCVTPDSTHLVVSGLDKQSVGQFASQVRASRLPDPYKAKGVKYQGEFIRRKSGKAFGSGG